MLSFCVPAKLLQSVLDVCFSCGLFWSNANAACIGYTERCPLIIINYFPQNWRWFATTRSSPPAAPPERGTWTCVPPRDTSSKRRNSFSNNKLYQLFLCWVATTRSSPLAAPPAGGTWTCVPPRDISSKRRNSFLTISFTNFCGVGLQRHDPHR